MLTLPPDRAHTRYVTVKKAATMVGLTEEAIRKRVQRGVWLEGREWVRDPLGRIMLDTEALDRWVTQTA